METSLNFDNYLFRCHSLGKIMTDVKPNLTELQTIEMQRLLDKQRACKITELQTITLGELLAKKNAKKELSVTTKNYLKKIHKEIIFKRTGNLRNKYCDKGIQGEEFSLTLHSNVSGKPFFKNKKRFENEYISGEPDSITKKVTDIKTSWDYETFPFYETEITNKDYDWQLTGYEILTGLKESELVYCLIDTPIKLINDEVRRLDWKEDVLNTEGDVREKSIPLVVELISSLIYTQKGLEEFCQQSTNINIEWFTDFREVPENLRVKVLPHKYDAEKENILFAQIKKCREYLNQLSDNVANQVTASMEVILN